MIRPGELDITCEFRDKRWHASFRSYPLARATYCEAARRFAAHQIALHVTGAWESIGRGYRDGVLMIAEELGLSVRVEYRPLRNAYRVSATWSPRRFWCATETEAEALGREWGRAALAHLRTITKEKPS